MSRKFSFVAMATMLLTVLLGLQVVMAQTVRTGGSANSQLLEQMQQLASERTSLQAENAKTKKELEDVRKERDALKNAQQGLSQRTKSAAAALEQANGQRATVTQELEQTKSKMQELIAKFRETIQTLNDLEAADATVKQTVATRDQELKSCVGHNLALAKLNAEILTHLEHESVWARVARTEPFTEIKRAQLENLVDDYKARAADQGVKPGGRAVQPAAPDTSPADAPSPAVKGSPAGPASTPSSAAPKSSGEPPT